MKMSESASKICGVQLGEASLNFIRVGEVPIKAKFALLTKDGDVAGFVDVSNGWSEKVLEAMRTFSEVLEAEMLGRLFEGQPSETAAKSEGSNEPQQF